MKKELIVCIFIFIIIITANIITQNYTKECVSYMNKELNLLKESSINNNNNKVIFEKISNIESTWSNYQEKLAYYIEHNELEKVETQIYAIKGLIESKSYDSMLSEIEKCSFILKHIEEKSKLSIKNIF